MMTFGGLVLLWYLILFVLGFINYKLIKRDIIERNNKITELQIKAHEAAFEWQKRQFYMERALS